MTDNTWKVASMPAGPAIGWVLEGEYPPDVIWIFVMALQNNWYQWLVVRRDRSYADGRRVGLMTAQRAAIDYAWRDGVRTD